MLDKTAQLERYLCKNPVTGPGDYFPIEEDTFSVMMTNSLSKADAIFVYPFFRSYEGNSFVDIYFFDLSLAGGYKRFVISRGKVMPPEEETLFLRLLQEEVVVDIELLKRCLESVSEKWDIQTDDLAEWRQTLLHIYFGSHSSGILGILFREKLDYIALSVDETEQINLSGASAEEIFELPFVFLRKCNSPEGVEILKKRSVRLSASILYQRYRCRIDLFETVNLYQLRYLQAVSQGKMPYVRILYKEIRDETVWRSLEMYYSYREKLLGKYSAFCPEWKGAGN